VSHSNKKKIRVIHVREEEENNLPDEEVIFFIRLAKFDAHSRATACPELDSG